MCQLFNSGFTSRLSPHSKSCSHPTQANVPRARAGRKYLHLRSASAVVQKEDNTLQPLVSNLNVHCKWKWLLYLDISCEKKLLNLYTIIITEFYLSTWQHNRVTIMVSNHSSVRELNYMYNHISSSCNGKLSHNIGVKSNFTIHFV